MVQINFYDEITEEINKDELALAQKVIEHILIKEGCPFDAEVNLTMTNDEGIWEVNREFREIDRPTDVLSFPNLDFLVPGDFSLVEENEMNYFDPETGMMLMGDIVISVDKVLEQAKEYGHSVKREFAFLVAHSMLHLCGYDHMEEEEKGQMRRKEEIVLNKLNIVR